MVEPASHSHSNGCALSAHTWRPSAKNVTPALASGGSTRARSTVGPLTKLSLAAETIVICGADGSDGTCADARTAQVAGTAMNDSARKRFVFITARQGRAHYPASAGRPRWPPPHNLPPAPA